MGESEGSKKAKIRLMQPGDWQQVAQLDVLAFNTYNQKTGKTISNASRTQTNLHACLAMNPNGCFVAETDRVSGFIFSRAWGNHGWVGTFAVDPGSHGTGIGKALLAAAVSSLETAGCTIVGLETMPDSPYNVGLYTRFGFNPVYPTLYLTRTPAACQIDLQVSLLSELDEKPALASVSALSQAARPGLDYALEARNAWTFGWGETLLFGWPQPWGFVILRTQPIRTGGDPVVCQVVSLAIVPEVRRRLGEVVQFLCGYAFDLEADQVELPVNTVDPQALHTILDGGFRVSRANLRMVYRAGYERPAGIDLSRWIM